MKYLIIISLILAMTSCAEKKSMPKEHYTEELKHSNNLFNEFLDSLPSYDLPLEWSCGLPESVMKSKFEKYQQYIPHRFNAVYGIIGNSKKYRTLVYAVVGDDIYPTLFTFNQKGEKIDSLFLLLSFCGGADSEVIPHARVKIQADHSIILTDTTLHIHIPEVDSKYSDYIIDSMSVQREEWVITEDGFLKKTDH